jgi:protein-disulfide isomerase
MTARSIAFAALLPVLLLAGCGGSSDNGPSDTVPIDELMASQALEDEWLGSADAPVTIIEYASMTCPHCRAFYETVFSDFVSEFVDTGQVRYALREFPLDERATAAIMLARCAPGENGFYSVVGHLFDTQSDWAAVEPDVFLDTLFGEVEQAGFTRDSFDACLSNQQLLDNVTAVQNHAVGLGVNSTPTFFINGKRYVGEISLEQLRAAIEDAQAG